MKEYETESQAALKWRCDEKSWRYWIQRVIDALFEIFTANSLVNVHLLIIFSSNAKKDRLAKPKKGQFVLSNFGSGGLHGIQVPNWREMVVFGT
jgi:hypothetical protein